MTFTEKDRRRLEALKEKERKAKQDEKNEQRRADNMCKKLFGKTAKQVKEELERKPDVGYQMKEYFKLRDLVTRLMRVTGKQYEDFPEYVAWREQKARENGN